MAEEDDPVVQEIDVFLSKMLLDSLYIFQYPVRPANMTYDDMTYLEARIKPIQQKVELELVLNTRSATYDCSKGEQIALNVDGTRKDESSFFRSSLMDKQVLTSTQALASASRYAVGLLKDGQLHLNPIRGIVQLRPSFGYLDRSDAKQKQESKDQGENAESSAEEEEEAQAVTVKFARPETDRTKQAREKSFRYLQQKMLEEPWHHVSYHCYQSEMSLKEKKLLRCSRVEDDVLELSASASDYLHMLVPDAKDTDFNKPSLPSNVLSMAQLRTLPLGEQIRALLCNAKVISFNQLMLLLSSDVDSVAVLRALQQVAMLVQGCWVVKSDILYPKDSCSPHSGVAAEILCRGRDYVKWRFTQCRLLIRQDIAAIIKLPPDDVKDILEQMARQRRGSKGWEFALPWDADFIQRYPDVVQRQQLLWEARGQQLVKSLRGTKAMAANDKGSAAEVKNSSPAKPRQRRRTKSQRESDSEAPISDVSRVETLELETEAAGVLRVKEEPMAVDLCNPVSCAPLSAIAVPEVKNSYPEKPRQRRRTKSQRDSDTEASSIDVLHVGNDYQTTSNTAVHVKAEPMEVDSCEPSASTLLPDLTTAAATIDLGRVVIKAEPVDMSQLTVEEAVALANHETCESQAPCATEMPAALVGVIRNQLTNQSCMTLSELRRLTSHSVTGPAIDGQLEQAILQAGASLLDVQWPNGCQKEPVYAIVNLGNELDAWRQALFSVFRTNYRCKKGVIKCAVEDHVGTSVLDAEFTKFLKHYCVGNRNGMYSLKGLEFAGS